MQSLIDELRSQSQLSENEQSRLFKLIVDASPYLNFRKTQKPATENTKFILITGKYEQGKSPLFRLDQELQLQYRLNENEQSTLFKSLIKSLLN
jgi:hypothetical protein